MTQEEQKTPPAQKHSPAEIIRIVRETQRNLNIPAVSSREIAKQLDYNDDYTTSKLNELVDDGELKGYRTGTGFIYWVPEEGEEGGEVDVSSMNSSLESLNPNQVPNSLAREIAEANLPDFRQSHFWQRGYDSAHSILQIGGVGFGIGLGIILTDTVQIESLYVPELIFKLAAVLFVSGGIAVSIAAVLILLFQVGRIGTEYGILPEEPTKRLMNWWNNLFDRKD